MIIITSLIEREYSLCPGDTFNLAVENFDGTETLIRETVTKNKVVNYIASFVFALDNGRVPSFNLCGIFTNKNDLPVEIERAVLVKDLTPEQRKNFIESCGINLCQ